MPRRPEDRKRRCENCNHWIKPRGTIYMGRCSALVQDNGMAMAEEGIWVSRYFYCCLYWRKDEAGH